MEPPPLLDGHLGPPPPHRPFQTFSDGTPHPYTSIGKQAVGHQLKVFLVFKLCSKECCTHHRLQHHTQLSQMQRHWSLQCDAFHPPEQI